MRGQPYLSIIGGGLIALGFLTLSTPSLGADDQAIHALLKKNDCFKCHAVNKTKKGPSYKKISAKLKEKANGDLAAAEKTIIKHITTGPKVKLKDGTEEDHKIIDTKDPAQLKAVADWILSL